MCESPRSSVAPPSRVTLPRSALNCNRGASASATATRPGDGSPRARNCHQFRVPAAARHVYVGPHLHHSMEVTAEDGGASFVLVLMLGYTSRRHRRYPARAPPIRSIDMLTRRAALTSAMATGFATLFPGARDAGAVPLPSTRVKFDVPKGLTDVHRHVVGDERYKYIPTSRYKLESATVEDMEALDKALGIDRVVLIALTGYGTDNSCLLD